jgi:TolA-binding protein/TolB-like protein
MDLGNWRMKMKNNILILLISILIPAVLLSQDSDDKKIRIAVAVFDDSLTRAAEQEKTGSSVSTMIESSFKGNDKFYLRERGAIQSYLTALAQVQTGVLGPESMKGDPQALKVDYLTVGTVSKIDGRYEVDARTVGIENMLIVHSHGSSAKSVSEAAKDIEWYIKEKFNRQYIKERESDNEDKATVTVFKFRDFNEQAGKSGYGGTFAEILNSQMGTFISIGAVERKYSKALVNEKALEMMGVVENDESGPKFSDKGIQYKVEGDIRVFADVICINYKMFNTADNSLVFMGSRDISSSSGLRPAAWSISNTIEDVLNNRIGTLKLTSTPDGADIYINGKKEGKTPAQLPVQQGNHKLMVKLDGFVPYKSDIEVQSKKIMDQTIVLKPVPFKIFENAMQFEKKRDWAGAIKAYSDFIKEYDDTVEADSAYYRKGHLEMMYTKNYQDALNTFEALVKRYPDAMIRAEGYYGMMRAYELMGNKQKALEIKQYILANYVETNAAVEAKTLNF